MDAKYIACCAAVQEGVWIIRFLRALGMVPHIKSHKDNTWTIDLAKEPKFHKRSKHIKRQFHFVQEQVRDGENVLQYVPSIKTSTNPMIKPIALRDFDRHVKHMGLRRVNVSWGSGRILCIYCCCTWITSFLKGIDFCQLSIYCPQHYNTELLCHQWFVVDKLVCPLAQADQPLHTSLMHAQDEV